MTPRPGEAELGKFLSDAILPLELDDDDHVSAVQLAVSALLAKGDVRTRWHHVRGNPLFPQTDEEYPYSAFEMRLSEPKVPRA